MDHKYLSTACLHLEHGYCSGKEGRAGPKVPAQCKFCAAPCLCWCHKEREHEPLVERGRDAEAS